MYTLLERFNRRFRPNSFPLGGLGRWQAIAMGLWWKIRPPKPLVVPPPPVVAVVVARRYRIPTNAQAADHLDALPVTQFTVGHGDCPWC